MSACDHSHEQLAGRSGPKSGPMGEKTRQQKYGQAIRGRLISIRAEMRRGVVERDVFGLETDLPANTDQLASDFDPQDLTPSGFDPTDDARNHEAFMDWLRSQMRRGVLGLISRGSNLYVRNAAADGVRWANARLREAGETVTDADVETTFNRPENANKLRLLYQRNYDLLEGITTDTSRQISEELSRGLAQGLGTEPIARSIADRIDSVGQYRATLVSRHETMYAANEFTKVRYREHGVETVTVIGSDPCDECAQYVGNSYPLDDIPEGGPPWHPQCVGSLIPEI